MVFKRNYLLPIFLVLQIVFLNVLSFFPEWVERWYSNGWYVVISKLSRTVLGRIPFSVGDILYGIVIVYLLLQVWKTRKLWKKNWKDFVLKTLSFVSVAYFLFHLLWALNYYRVPLFEKMNIQREYSDEDLVAFTEKLIAQTNEVQFQITKNKNTKVTVPYSQESIFEKTQNGYNHLAKEYSFFA